MKGGLNRDWYCSDASVCHNRHRKWPTPEQFREEYGESYSDDAMTCCLCTFSDGVSWEGGDYKSSKMMKNKLKIAHVACACTPWGKPPNDWRLE